MADNLVVARVKGTDQNALNRLFEVPPADTMGKGIYQFTRHRLVSFAILIIISFILSVSLVLDAAISAFDLSLAAWLGQFSHTMVVIDSLLVELLTMTLLFALMFRYLPDVRLKWRDTWIGALLTAALFSFGEYLIGYLIGSNGDRVSTMRRAVSWYSCFGCSMPQRYFFWGPALPAAVPKC